MTDSSFHITVATAPIAGPMDLVHDLRLVKAALLYGDRVTLCSPMASLAMDLAGMKR